jgi:hypothetical protein
MSPTLTRTPPPVAATAPRARDLVLAALLGLPLLVLVSMAARDPDRVPALTVENGSPYRVTVTVSGPSGGAVVLGAVDREHESTFTGVLDAGREWVVRFRSAGVDAGTVVVDRADLEAADWRVRVPEDVAARLAPAGVTEAP